MGASIAVDQATFDREVIKKSYEKPVLVDFFAQWCGPCQMLKPMLEKLVQEYDFVLAKVDIDASPELAQTYGVQGVPDVRIVVEGQVREGFVGVLPEPKLRQLLTQLNLKSSLDESLNQIYLEATQGNVEQAKTQMAALLDRHPEDRTLILEAANFYIEADDLDTAEALLAKISEYEKEYSSALKSLKALIQFKQILHQPIEDNDLDRNFHQAAQSVLEENYEAALQQFLAVVSCDRRYREDGARKAMLAIFDLLGDENPLTKDYRKQLMLALY